MCRDFISWLDKGYSLCYAVFAWGNAPAIGVSMTCTNCPQPHVYMEKDASGEGRYPLCARCWVIQMGGDPENPADYE